MTGFVRLGSAALAMALVLAWPGRSPTRPMPHATTILRGPSSRDSGSGSAAPSFRTTIRAGTLAAFAAAAALVSASPADAGARHKFKFSLSLTYEASRQEVDGCGTSRQYKQVDSGTQTVVVSTVRPGTLISEAVCPSCPAKLYPAPPRETKRPMSLSVSDTRSSETTRDPACKPPDPPPPPPNCGTRSITTSPLLYPILYGTRTIELQYDLPSWTNTDTGDIDCRQPTGAGYTIEGWEPWDDRQRLRTPVPMKDLLSHRDRRTVVDFSDGGSGSDAEVGRYGSDALEYTLTVIQVR